MFLTDIIEFCFLAFSRIGIVISTIFDFNKYDKNNISNCSTNSSIVLVLSKMELTSKLNNVLKSSSEIFKSVDSLWERPVK